MGFEITIDAHGSIFDGRAEAIVSRYAHDLQEKLADTGVSWIRAYLPTQYMYLGHNGGNPKDNPIPANAGYYQSVIHHVDSGDSVLIHDTPCVYGPWLEGVGSKNPVVWPGRLKRGLSGRFDGYHTFKVISQRLDAAATGIAYEMLPKYVEEINA